MDQLSELRAFCRVAEAGSFSAAAAAATFNGSRMVVPSRYRRHGMPAAPADPARHKSLTHTIVSPQEWTFVLPDGGLQTVAMRGSLHANTGVALRLAALGGIGIAATAPFFAKVRAFVEFAAEVYRRPAWS